MLCTGRQVDNGMTGDPRSVQAPQTECMARSLKAGASYSSENGRGFCHMRLLLWAEKLDTSVPPYKIPSG